jgi:hypothetical protein
VGCVGLEIARIDCARFIQVRKSENGMTVALDVRSHRACLIRAASVSKSSSSETVSLKELRDSEPMAESIKSSLLVEEHLEWPEEA